MPKPRILAIGSANLDILLKTDRLPSPGETVISDGSYTFMPGGKGLNSAIAASRSGADVLFCSRVGTDYYGSRLVDFAAKCGIDTRLMTEDKKRQTGTAFVMVERGGENRIVVFRGANDAVNDDDIEEGFMCYPDAVLISLEINEYIVKKAISYAAEKGVPVFMDAGPARADYPLYDLARLEVFSPNETETYIYTGIMPESHNDYVRAAMRLSELVDAHYYVLKLGGRGCFITDGKYSEILPAYSVTAVDTTSAGDTFTAALTAEYLRTGDMVKAGQYANAAGAIAVTRHGSSSSIPTDDEVREFMSAHKIVF